MICYKKYKQVLWILNWDIKRDISLWSSIWDFAKLTNEDKASYICELFDKKETITPIYPHWTIIPQFSNWWTVPLDINNVTC
jgi:hypothetical protein